MIKASEARRTADVQLVEKRKEWMQVIERGIQNAANEGYYYYATPEPMLTAAVWKMIEDELGNAGFDVRHNDGILTIMWSEDDDDA